MRLCLVFSALTAFTLFSCADSAPDQEPGIQLIVAAQHTDGCQHTTNGSRNFPEGVDRFEMRLTGGEAFAASLFPDDLNDAGEILVQKVPPGEGLQLDLFGCSGSDLTWSGRTTEVTVTAGDKTAPSLFFTRKNAFNCPGGPDAGKHGYVEELKPVRAMHTVEKTADGRLLIIGGFNTYVPLSPQVLRVGDGVDTITEYDPARGLFRTWDAQLEAPRGAHHSVALEGGRKILVIGGLTRAALQPAPFAPLTPAPEDGSDTADPATPVELIDVDAREVSASPLALAPRPMGAVAGRADGGSVTSCGGTLTNGEPSNDVAVATGDLSSASAEFFTTKLAVPRMGHSATSFGSGHVLVLGGNFGALPSAGDSDPSNLAEVLPADSSTAARVTLEGDVIPPPMGLHQTVLVRSDDCRHTFLVSGGMGLERNADSIPIFISASRDPSRLYLLQIDACDIGAITGRFADQSPAFDPIRVRRVFHSLVPLGDDLVLMSGGFNQLSKPTNPSTWCVEDKQDTGCYFDDVLLLEVQGGGSDVSVQAAAAESLRFDRARFGHAVTLMNDGTALSTGGVLARDGGLENVVADAEIFNPVRPGQQDVCSQ